MVLSGDLLKDEVGTRIVYLRKLFTKNLNRRFWCVISLENVYESYPPD